MTKIYIMHANILRTYICKGGFFHGLEIIKEGCILLEFPVFFSLLTIQVSSAIVLEAPH
jgi:hypothetical protein